MMKKLKFNNQCRACRRFSPKLTPLLSKLEDFDKITIKQCIESSLGLTCELSSNLPSKLCDFCIDELKITYIFNEKYRQSDTFFKNMVLQSMKEIPELQLPEVSEILDEEQEQEHDEEDGPVEEEMEEEDLVQNMDNTGEEYIEEQEPAINTEDFDDDDLENVDVLEGYEQLVEDENEEWLESNEKTENNEDQDLVSVLETDQINSDDNSQTVYEALEDIIVEEIDESELPSILDSESIAIHEEEVHTEEESNEKSGIKSHIFISTPYKKKMVFSMAELNKGDGNSMEIQETTQYFDEFDNSEELEQVSVSKRQPQLSLEDLDRRHVIPTIKSVQPSKIEGGSLVIVNGETFHKCDQCDRRFSKRYLLKSHIKSVHLRIREHCCSLCPKQFTSKLRLEEHFRTHTGERPFKCDYCPMAFTTPTQRKLHSITHTRSNPYSCEYCGKTFSSHATLHGHKFIHTRQGVECPVCKKMFARQVDVKKHMAVHTKEKSFICKICDKGYLYNTSLKAHMKNHPFDNVQCKHCNEDILNIDQWNYHLQLHAKEVFECTTCGTTFMEQHELFTHLRTSHSTLDMTQHSKKETHESWIDN